MNADLHLIARWLQACRTHRSLSRGRQLHQLLLKCGHGSSLQLSNCLLQMYSFCSPSVDDARKVFDEMPCSNSFSWNSLIDAHLKFEEPHHARQMFDSMSCKNTYSWNAMITGLVRCGDLYHARRLLEEMPVVDDVACNAVLHAYIRRGQPQEAFNLFKKVSSELNTMSLSCGSDKFVLATLLSACAECLAYDYGRQIHSRIVIGQVDLDSVLGSALVNMYAKCESFDSASGVLELMQDPDEFSLSALISGFANCGRLDEARSIFDRRKKPSVVLWNSIINAYSSANQGAEALKFFKWMILGGVVPDSSTFASVLSACASTGIPKHAMQMHACGCKQGIVEDLIVASALIDSYSKCGIWEDACKVFKDLRVHDTILLNTLINVYSNSDQVDEARRIFEMISCKNIISWNSMIVGYSQNSRPIKALELFIDMHRLDLRLDEVAIASALSCCASLCALAAGQQLFALATQIGTVTDLIITSALVDLYCKCGTVIEGRRLFDSVQNHDVALWNSMLMGYASNGYAIQVIELFETLRNAAGVCPNEVTFIAVLSACCHCGLVEEGLRWFHRMKVDYRIEPVVEHYSCVVDLLVRAGRLEESIEFIDAMPFKADASMWTSVLGGCKAHGDEVLGSKVAERLLEHNPQDAGPFLQLSSIYAACGEWESSAQFRQMMLNRKISKSPGYSWIDS
ncbi:putative pentatricopeptide repeat-containing protein At1g77010, mitochondrial [Zingiber officinale]|uniref:putative pentatricopeptide repeat-containing protein At1g77010, mitochondrial n=1 Tax=Zingiber officinale TaxID=94328 RepID=UPI001C4AFCE6|nr:putative pentatricopeptide repeat-containing protein At1g77010, mitochondrial [Zingiber officinale]XP_042463023.1 putative pentatricopeptide repeat-containing protein At1g77010, mitochondrial [Zingiber officinale]XP_042463024.1 putative pentatricopeptide repeat-containing protein At1g77010, mitochondrial [Zingiber officinale]XP_042463025.1 putative pentatricopeptide repeat-containing protein At1g77010, mitochondrial [Zingiber officinale]